MANLTELAQFDSVYQIETTDLVQGGASGVTNTPLKNLTNRTLWLKQQATFKQLKRGVVSPYLEVLGTANVAINKASDIYGKIVPVYHNDPGSVSTGSITLATSDMTADDFGTIVRFIVSTAGIEGVKVEIKVGSTVLGELDSGTGYSVEVVFNGTTWEANTESILSEIGQVVSYARNTAPLGWLKCNGAAVSRTTYARLFRAIGTTFGVGNGSTTFNLPDLRGEFIRGWADDRAVDTSRVFGSTQADELKSHTHSHNTTNKTGLSSAGYGTNVTVAANLVAGTPSAGPISDATGGTETRPRNVALLYCIKF
jgi:microcystin-dependent protein